MGLVGKSLIVCLALVLGVAIPGWVGPVIAEEASVASRTLQPKLPTAKGDKCVADTDVMRRNHMNFLKHQRDDTVRDGVRTKQFSLKQCLTCHAVNGPDAKPVTADNPDHFCRVCHDYAAVRIDCFDCHASRPEAAAKSGRSLKRPLEMALTDYLKGVSQ